MTDMPAPQLKEKHRFVNADEILEQIEGVGSSAQAAVDDLEELKAMVEALQEKHAARVAELEEELERAEKKADDLENDDSEIERLRLENDGLKAMLRTLGVSDRVIEMADGGDEIDAQIALRCYNV